MNNSKKEGYFFSNRFAKHIHIGMKGILWFPTKSAIK